MYLEWLRKRFFKNSFLFKHFWWKLLKIKTQCVLKHFLEVLVYTSFYLFVRYTKNVFIKIFQDWLVATVAGVGFRKFPGRVTESGGWKLANDDHWRLA